MLPVGRVTVIYDAQCGLCTRVKAWMERQAALVDTRFAPSGSLETQRMFPQIPAGELAVVADTGDVWLGNRAWVVCLWALREYRDLAVRLTSPLLLLMAREAFALVSANRAALSSLLRLRSERELEQSLRKVAVPRCQIEPK